MRGKVQQPVSLLRASEARQAAYRLLAGLFLYPEAGRLERLSQVAGALEGEPLSGFQAFAAWRGLVEALAVAPDQGLPSLQANYLRRFSLAGNGPACLPWESASRRIPEHEVGWLLAHLQQHYAAAGLAPSSREPPDHVSTELEFLAFLCQQEALAWKEGRAAEGLALVERQTAFLGEHPSRWLPGLARALAQDDRDDFYARLAKAAAAFSLHDLGFLDALGGYLRQAPHHEEGS